MAVIIPILGLFQFGKLEDVIRLRPHAPSTRKRSTQEAGRQSPKVLAPHNGPTTTHLVVVLLDDHFEVQTGELAQVSVRPRFLGPEHRADLSTQHNTRSSSHTNLFQSSTPAVLWSLKNKRDLKISSHMDIVTTHCKSNYDRRAETPLIFRDGAHCPPFPLLPNDRRH